MAEAKIKTINPFEPGTVIEFTDLNEIPAFEDKIIDFVEPDYNLSLWQGRVPIGNLLRPAAFNGRITKPTLTVMENPYEDLLEARADGWKIGGGVFQKNSDNSTAEHCVGFTFRATPMSSGGGLKDTEIASVLWYYPMPKQILRREGEMYSKKHILETGEEVLRWHIAHKGYSYNKGSQVGIAIRRVVAKPVFNTNAFNKSQERSKKVGLEITKQAIARPLPGSMSQ